MKTNKILVIGPSWVGDMVMAQSLFKLLKLHSPNLKLDVLSPEWAQPVLSRMPEVDESICIPIPHGKLMLKKRIELARTLKKNKYDQAIVLTNTWKSAFVPFLAGIPIRTGWLGECRWGLLNDVRYLDKKLLPKMVQRYVSLGLPENEKLPRELPTPKLIAKRRAEHKELVTAKKVLAFCPGAAYGPAKRWPEEYYAQVAKEKIADGWDVWLFGSGPDLAVIASIQEKIGSESTSFGGKIDLLETIDLLSLADAVVTNDSGLLHIASSLDKPLVAIYGSSSPEFTPPLGNKSKYLYENISCSPCFKRECPLGHFKCMRDIEPQAVLNTLRTIE